MKSNNTYGVVYGPDNIHADVSRTLRGAKQYATRNGYGKVSVRYNSGYVCSVLATKINNKWVNYEN